MGRYELECRLCGKVRRVRSIGTEALLNWLHSQSWCWCGKRASVRGMVYLVRIRSVKDDCKGF